MMYGHSGNKTTAIIAIKIAGNSQVFGSVESNLKEANFDFLFPSDFYSYWGYFNFGILSGL